MTHSHTHTYFNCGSFLWYVICCHRH